MSSLSLSRTSVLNDAAPAAGEIVLRTLHPRHLAAFAHIRSRPVSGAFMARGGLEMDEAFELARDLLAGSRRERARGGAGTWAVLRATRCVGFVGFAGVLGTDSGDETELFFLVDPDYWGQGIATRAVAAALAARAARGDHRPSVAWVDVRNEASQRVLLRCDYLLTGLQAHGGLACWTFRHAGGIAARGPAPAALSMAIRRMHHGTTRTQW